PVESPWRAHGARARNRLHSASPHGRSLLCGQGVGGPRVARLCILRVCALQFRSAHLSLLAAPRVTDRPCALARCTEVEVATGSELRGTAFAPERSIEVCLLDLSQQRLQSSILLS